MDKQLIDIIDCIDRTLGEGYARKNPELIGRLMQAQSAVVSATIIQDGLYAIGFLDDDVETAH